MANVQIPNLGVAISLSGTEEVEVVQSGTSRRATTQQIANLYNSGITAAGSNTQVQFNDGGLLNGDADFTFDKTTNQIAIGAGSAAAPTLIPTGDTNTGIWFPAAGTIAASTGGSERFRIDSSGNVGIGTTSPTTLLSVNGVASFGAGTAALPSVAAFGDLDTGMWFPAANTIAWSNGGSERMRVDASGRLLIGTSTAYSVQNYAGIASTTSLQNHSVTTAGAGQTQGNWATSATSVAQLLFSKSVSGTVGTRGALTLSGTNLGSVSFSGDNGTDFIPAAGVAAFVDAAPSGGDMPGRLAFFTTAVGAVTGTERMRINSSGNVGIGTSAPTTLLSVNGVASFGAGTAALPSVAAFGDLDTGMWFPAANTVAFSTGGIERMRIDSTGIISATSSNSFLPQLFLTNTASNNFGPYWFTGKYRGTAPANAGDTLGTFQFESANSSNVGGQPAAIFRAISNGAGATFHSGYLQFITYDLSGTFGIRMVVNEQGVQTTDGTAALPSISFIADPNTGFWRPAADTVALSTNGSERMRIDSSGNVGIGTSSPGHLLQVNSTGSTISATTSSTTTQFTGPGLRLYNTNASMGTQAGLGIASLILDASATQGYMSFFQTNNSGGFVRDILRYNYNASLWQFYTNATEKLRIDTSGNLGLGATTFGTSAATVLGIATGTAPTTGPADTIQIYSTDLSAGNTMLSLYTEGTVVNANTTAAATHRIAIRVNGTVYYLLANTSST